MKIVEVDYIPETIQPVTCERKKVISVIEDFLYKSDAKFVRVDYTYAEYKYPTACRASFAAAIERRGYPVRVLIRNGEVYLAREIYLNGDL